MVDDGYSLTSEARRELKGVQERARLRDQSKLAFGTQSRLEIALAILQHGGLVTNEIVRGAASYSQSTTHVELTSLEKLGLIVRVSRGTGRTVYYRAVAHPFWDLCRRLAADILG